MPERRPVIPCPHCRGFLYRDLDDIRCLLCGRSTTPLRPAPPLPGVTKRHGAGRPSKLDADQLAAIRTEAATVPRGLRSAYFQRIATEHGMSAVYVQALATGYKRA